MTASLMWAAMADVIPMPLGARPFVKWVGGKRQLLAEIHPLVPAKFGRYFEPFVGGGAVFFDLAQRVGPAKRGSWATLGDSNMALVAAYKCVRDNVEGLTSRLRVAEKSHTRRKEKFYYDLRANHNPVSDLETATRFIALQKLGFNGVYRVNLAGEYNVPYGKWKTVPNVCDEVNLRACAKVLRSTSIVCGDFEKVLEKAAKGDFVYCDPPYVPASDSANFTTYTAGGFGPEDQERLRDVALRLKKKGVKVLLSNSDVPQVRKLYRGFEVRRIEARRSVNSKVTSRGPVGELLLW